MRELPLPVTVIGGYLGAGKTTLVNHLLRHADGRRIAVLVNDFGELPIDAALIEGADGDVLSLAGGCVCCSYGSDLVGALMDLPRRASQVEQILIETSGVALPGAVANTLTLLADYRLDAVVVLADAETLRQRAADPYLGDTIARQLAAADIVLLNKADLVAPTVMHGAAAYLATAAPAATVLRATRAAVPVDIVLGTHRLQRPGIGLTTPGLTDPASLYESILVPLPSQVDIDRIGRALIDPALGLIRAKGVLRDRDGTVRALHVVGGRWATDGIRTGTAGDAVVLIGLRGSFDQRRARDVLASSTA